MSERGSEMQFIVGIDIGGTGTDCVVVDDAGEVTLGKAFSTPPEFATGILNAVSSAADALGLSRGDLLARTSLFLHSTPVAESAVVDQTLATGGILVSEGFEDTLFSMRGGYGRWSGLTEEGKRNPIDTDKPKPIVPRVLVRGIKGRTDAQGQVRVPVDPAQVETALRELLAA